MISSEIEYQKAQEELEYLKAWMARLVNDTTTKRSGFTVVSVHSKISRVSKEIASYEASKMATSEESESMTEDEV